MCPLETKENKTFRRQPTLLAMQHNFGTAVCLVA